MKRNLVVFVAIGLFGCAQSNVIDRSSPVDGSGAQSGDAGAGSGGAGGTTGGATGGATGGVAGSGGAPAGASGGGGAAAGGTGGTGGTPAPALLSASATNAFGNVEVGMMSGPVTWSVTNTGGSPTGTLTLSNGAPTEISVGANTCTGTLAAGASCTVSLAFRPAEEGSRSGTLSLSATPGGTVTFGATARGQYRITVTVTGGGTVTSEPAGINCGTACSMLVDAYSTVTLKAVTTNGSNLLFTGWTGVCAGPVRDCPVTVNRSSSAAATFSPLTANLVFISSLRVPPNKGSLAAYDADCNAVATVAGINNTTRNGYVAFMSDATTAAPSRIPASARGWVRIDGKPFADTLASLAPGNRVFNPILFDELGNRGVTTLTGTSTDGSVGDTCESWTSSADTSYASLGSPNGGPGAWVFVRADAHCSQATTQPTYGVICMGTTRNSAVSPVVTAGRKIWVTSTGFIPGSGQTPDAKCQSERPAGVTTAIALIATTTQSAGSRLDPTATYVRVDGTLVGTGTQIANRGFSSGVWQSADGTYRATSASYSFPYAWIGAPTPSGPGLAYETCANWTDSAGTGIMGDWTDAHLRWGVLAEAPCTRSLSLFCVQTAP